MVTALNCFMVAAPLTNASNWLIPQQTESFPRLSFVVCFLKRWGEFSQRVAEPAARAVTASLGFWMDNFLR